VIHYVNSFIVTKESSFEYSSKLAQSPVSSPVFLSFFPFTIKNFWWGILFPSIPCSKP